MPSDTWTEWAFNLVSIIVFEVNEVCNFLLIPPTGTNEARIFSGILKKHWICCCWWWRWWALCILISQRNTLFIRNGLGWIGVGLVCSMILLCKNVWKAHSNIRVHIADWIEGNANVQPSVQHTFIWATFRMATNRGSSTNPEQFLNCVWQTYRRTMREEWEQRVKKVRQMYPQQDF